MSPASTLSRSLVALVLAAGGLTLAAPAAAVPTGAPAVAPVTVLATDHRPVGRAQTVLRVNRETADVLRDKRITVKGRDGTRATSSGDRVVEVGFTVRRSDSRAKRIDHEGRLVFSRNRAQVTLDQIRVEGNRITARVGGSNRRIDLFTLEGGVSRFDDDALILENRTAKLADAAARRLNATLGVAVFRKGATVGTVTLD